jgi:F0F1-type ATP synthase assembly protein I
MSNDSAYYRLAFKIVSDLTGSIAVPAVLAAFGGKWLDAKYHTAPRYLILLLILAFVLSAVHIVKKSVGYRNQYEAVVNAEPKDHPKNPV